MPQSYSIMREGKLRWMQDFLCEQMSSSSTVIDIVALRSLAPTGNLCISLLQSSTAATVRWPAISTSPRQVDSSQNRVAKDVLPTAPSPRRMTYQCSGGAQHVQTGLLTWCDMDKKLMWLHACCIHFQKTPSLAIAHSRAEEPTWKLTVLLLPKDGKNNSRFLMVLLWNSNFFGSKCITILPAFRPKKLPRCTGMSALNCTYSGSSSSSSSPSLRDSAEAHSTTWAAGEGSNEGIWSA